MGKTKEQKAQIRKEGWQEVKDAVSEMRKGKVTPTTYLADQVAANKGKTVKQIVRENVSPSGIVGNVIKSVKDTGKIIKGGAKILKGVFKGIFNHPSWYKYKGQLSIPANNPLRPFDPRSIKSIMGSIKSAPGVGVTHVVQNNIEFNDMLEDDGFELAMTEAFKEVRRELRSNLPYTQKQFNQFIEVAMVVAIQAKTIERTLGWYTVTMGDIPELQDAISSVSTNPNEFGRIGTVKIGLINEENYAHTLNAYRKLKALVANISIPKKLSEFISWWVGSVFTDQHQPNKQLYFNMLRNCPLYSFDANTGELITTGQWDIADGTINEVYDEANTLLNTMGVINADMEKMEIYGKIQLSEVTINEYNPVMLEDAEFFTILINNYTLNRESNTASYMTNKEYVRVDVLDEISESNLVGVSNALAQWAGYKTPFHITSQCCYITSDTTLRTPRNVQAFGDISSADVTESMSVEGLDPNGFFFQYTSNGEFNDLAYLTPSSTVVNAQYSANSKALNTTLPGTFQAGSVEFWNAKFTHTGHGQYLVKRIARSYDNAQGLYLIFTISGTAITTCGLYTGAANAIDPWEGSLMDNISAFSLVVNVPVSTYVPTYSVDYPVLFSNYVSVSINMAPQTPLTLTAAQYNRVLPFFVVGSEINTYQLNVLNLQYTTTSISVALKRYNTAALAQVLEMIDYHLPVLLIHGLQIGNGTHYMNSWGSRHLLKATYRPIVFNYSDIEAVLYWMYLGLFSIE